MRDPSENKWIAKLNKTGAPCGWCKRTRSSYWRTVKQLKAAGDTSLYCNSCSCYHNINKKFSSTQHQKYIALWDRFHLKEDDVILWREDDDMQYQRDIALWGQPHFKEDDQQKSISVPATLEEYIPAFHARAAEVIGPLASPLSPTSDHDTLEAAHVLVDLTSSAAIPTQAPTSSVISPDWGLNWKFSSDAAAIPTQAPVTDDWLMEKADELNQILDTMPRKVE